MSFKRKYPKDNILQLYLKEVYFIPRLSLEKEAELFKSFRSGDEKSKKILIESNLRLAASIVRKKYSSQIDILELIQEANMALIKAVEEFDFEKGYRFSTFASPCIKRRIRQKINNYQRIIDLPYSEQRKITGYNKTEERLFQKLKLIPSEEEVTEEANLDPKKIKHLRKIAKREISLETPLNSEEDQDSFGSTIADNGLTTEELVINIFLKKEVEQIISCFSDREKKIITMRFGLDGDSPKKLEEIGKEIGLTRERVRQILFKLLEIIKTKKGKSLKEYL